MARLLARHGEWMVMALFDLGMKVEINIYEDGGQNVNKPYGFDISMLFSYGRWKKRGYSHDASSSHDPRRP
jgi:hypothetical protein